MIVYKLSQNMIRLSPVTDEAISQSNKAVIPAKAGIQ